MGLGVGLGGRGVAGTGVAVGAGVASCGRTVGGNGVGTAVLSEMLIIGKLIVNPLDKACLGVMVAGGVLSTTSGVGSTVAVISPLEITGK